MTKKYIILTFTDEDPYLENELPFYDRIVNESIIYNNDLLPHSASIHHITKDTITNEDLAFYCKSRLEINEIEPTFKHIKKTLEQL
jgi:hypothetical protein